jgi:hypothetical protein
MIILLILLLRLNLCLKKIPCRDLLWSWLAGGSGGQANLLPVVVEIEELSLERFDEILEFFFKLCARVTVIVFVQ